MLNLNDREWRAFAIKDIFVTEKKKIIQVPTGAYVHKTKLHKGKTPRITVTSFSNGVDGYYNSTDKNYRVFNNFISVSFLGTVFYHPYEASIDMKVHCLQLLDKDLNRYISKFLIAEIKQSISNASYGDQLSSTDLPNKMIMLPTTDKGTPDYAFMEQYIKEREDKLKQKYIDFIGNNYRIGGVLPSLEEKTWKAFIIGDLFDSYTGTDLIISKIKEGEIPVISHAAMNNGIACYSAVIERRPIFSHNNTISLADRGNFKAFVQKTDFYIGTRVKALVSKNVFPKEVLIFIANSIDKQAIKFSYGYNATDNIDKLHILLPTTDEGSPDYEYMEQYIKAVMFEKYKKYLEYQNCPLL